MTLSRDGHIWYPRRSIRSLDVRDGLLVTEAVYRLGGRPLRRRADRISVAMARDRSPSAGLSDRARSWLWARARTIYRGLSSALIPHAKVVTAVAFVGDQQVRAHRVTSRVRLLAREGGFSCGWSDGEQPSLVGRSASYVGTATATSAIRPLEGFDRALLEAMVWVKDHTPH